MKWLLLVVGCYVALAVAHSAEDVCAAMRARLLHSLEPSARADASALRACDADSDGAVDATELVRCVRRAFGSTSRMDRAETTKKIHCFRRMMKDSALHGEERRMLDSERERRFSLGVSAVSEGSKRSAGDPSVICEDQNQLAEILAAIADGRLQTAYDELINWYISIIAQSSGLLNGLLQNVGFVLQLLLSGRSHETLVYLVTKFVRSASNALTPLVEDSLISSLLQISIDNFNAAKIIIEVRLAGGVLNPATEDELRWIIDAFDDGSAEDAVARIIALLAGCDTSNPDSGRRIFPQLFEMYDMFLQMNEFFQPGPEFENLKNLFRSIYDQAKEKQPPLDSDFMNFFEQFVDALSYNTVRLTFIHVGFLLAFPCKYEGPSFVGHVAIAIFEMRSEGVTNTLQAAVESFGNSPEYSGPMKHVQLALKAYNNSDIDGAIGELRNIFTNCADMTDM